MMSPWPCVSRNVILSFFLQSGLSAPATSSPLLYFDVRVTPWKACLLQSSEGLNTLPKVSGQNFSSGKMQVKPSPRLCRKTCKSWNLDLSEETVETLPLPSVPPAPRVSGIRPHSRRPCVCSLPLLSPLLTFVVKIWKGCTGIQIVHLPFLCTGAKIQASYYVHNHSKL